jgi:TonB family protein
MYFDFEDCRPDTPTIESAISRREGILLSVVAHFLLLATYVYGPRIPVIKQLLQLVETPPRAVAQKLEEAPRFVFVQPKLDMPAKAPPPRADLSDQNRVARNLERPPAPSNPLPYSRGNTKERLDTAPQPPQQPRGVQPETPPGDQAPPPATAPPADQGSLAYQQAAPPQRPDQGRQGGTLSSAISDALKNLQRYTKYESFDNPQGGVGAFGPSIQFDTKGVEFGPWIRRFIAQIKRNWDVPYAAMSFHGHVVLTFNVHRDGRITDLQVLKPSDIEGFTTAAYNAVAASSPTFPLPPEYPSDAAFFTVTFYYNENPPSY